MAQEKRKCLKFLILRVILFPDFFVYILVIVIMSTTSSTTPSTLSTKTFVSPDGKHTLTPLTDLSATHEARVGVMNWEKLAQFTPTVCDFILSEMKKESVENVAIQVVYELMPADTVGDGALTLIQNNEQQPRYYTVSWLWLGKVPGKDVLKEFAALAVQEAQEIVTWHNLVNPSKPINEAPSYFSNIAMFKLS
jgi:hypothetical protein